MALDSLHGTTALLLASLRTAMAELDVAGFGKRVAMHPDALILFTFHLSQSFVVELIAIVNLKVPL